MSTKGQRLSKERRRMRKKEKNSDVKYDISLGRTTRRGWGKGKAK